MKKAVCTCGDIELEISAEPVSKCFCYCTECQKLSGTDKTFVALFPSGTVNVQKGEPKQHSRRGDSGKEVTYHFCSSCSSVLFTKPEAMPLISVPVARIQNAGDWQPQMAIYTSSAPSWAVFNPELPAFEKAPG